MKAADVEIRERWSRWLVERNQRGRRMGTLVGGTVYPVSGIVDRIMARTSALPWLWVTRGSFDSLMTLNFVATLKATLGVTDPPFEQWPAERSARVDAVTVGSLVDRLRSLPEVRAGGIGEPRTAAPTTERNGRPPERG